MRPSLLQPLFMEAQSLDGIGPKLTQLLGKLLNSPAGSDPRILDLIWHLPTGATDRRARPKISEALPGQLATLEVTILKHFAPKGRQSRTPYRVICEDDSGQIDLIFFRGDKKYLEAHLPLNQTVYISGRVEHYGDKVQMPHPDYILSAEEFASLPLIEPTYPLTAGLSAKVLRKAINQALEKVPDMPEWQNESWLKQQQWSSFNASLAHIHKPDLLNQVATSAPERARIAYDELLANQLALALVRLSLKKAPGREIKGDGAKRNMVLRALPFELTNGQQDALDDIYQDMAAPNRMLRLLQGDVGSGKTIVALMAMANAIETGLQTALMAPTEVLARQHAETLAPLCEQAGISFALLTGREKGKTRRQILEYLAEGQIDILIGTHALFQGDVQFSELGFVVIDEQHRFGVHQRLALQAKGGALGADVLVMTATPIPRTLLLTHYGDMSVSKLYEKPAGRKPVTTVTVPIERLEDVMASIGRALQKGAQIYWVCPLVESSEKVDMAAAEERFAHLKQRFGEQVGLVHGKMKGADKDAVMKGFMDKHFSILVSTTVIEVGVNVPNATIMVIEHAERFGLSQLHQLRGRVGRGERQSSCILLYAPPLSENGKARLEIMRKTEDGFLIAEEDLRLRGGGEVLGARQSGLPEFRLANIPQFSELLNAARDDAQMIIQQDPTLASARGKALLLLLYLFECDEAIRLFQAG